MNKKNTLLGVRIFIKDIIIITMFFLTLFIIVSLTIISVANIESNIKESEEIDTYTVKIRENKVNITDEIISYSEESFSKEFEKEHEILKSKYKKIKKITKEKIQKEKKLKIEQKKRKEYKEDVELLAHLIYGEAGDQCDECQQAVGQVVLNRVKSKIFKQNTVRGVIFARRQYACTWDGNFDKTPSEQAYKNAKAVLDGDVIIKVPEDVLYQSQFPQGSGVWKKIGTETFCYY